jgi:DnaJ domain
MTQIHTHYDNLKVARNAPPQVIRAAYRTLAQHFHPDRNPGNAEAARIMAIINTSYDVLSDPAKRREHDLSVQQRELMVAQAAILNSQPLQAPTQQSLPPSVGAIGVATHVFRYWILYGVAGLFVWLWAMDKPSAPLPELKPYQANPSSAPPAYIKPSTAPNGEAWPTAADYVKGYPRLHTNGLSTVTVDNSKNNSEVFVKLVSLDNPEAYPVRQFYIPALRSITISKVTAGSYDIRYRDLSNGGLSRSAEFNLEEIPTHSGTQFSNITMTLYKVQNGNMKTYGLSETEF